MGVRTPIVEDGCRRVCEEKIGRLVANVGLKCVCSGNDEISR